jgi:hypothetical protein
MRPTDLYSPFEHLGWSERRRWPCGVVRQSSGCLTNRASVPLPAPLRVSRGPTRRMLSIGARFCGLPAGQIGQPEAVAAAVRDARQELRDSLQSDGIDLTLDDVALLGHAKSRDGEGQWWVHAPGAVQRSRLAQARGHHVPGYRVRNHPAGAASGLVCSASGAGGFTAPARGPFSRHQDITAAIGLSFAGEGSSHWADLTWSSS